MLCEGGAPGLRLPRELGGSHALVGAWQRDGSRGLCLLSPGDGAGRGRALHHDAGDCSSSTPGSPPDTRGGHAAPVPPPQDSTGPGPDRQQRREAHEAAAWPLGAGDKDGGTELLVGALGWPRLAAVTNGVAGPFPDPTISMATARSMPQPPGDPRLEAVVGPGPGGLRDPPAAASLPQPRRQRVPGLQEGARGKPASSARPHSLIAPGAAGIKQIPSVPAR